LSSISGCRFESGLSFGAGLTSELKFQLDPKDKNLRWADTPGLADMDMAEKAALAIGKALKSAVKERRRVKLFFVVTAESGRLRPADHLTINKVVGCINLPKQTQRKQNSFGIIVNKVSWLGSRKAEKGMNVLRSIFAVKTKINQFPTSFVHFLPVITHLVDQDDATHDFGSLYEWMLTMDGIKTVYSVDDIDVRNIDEQLQKQAEVNKQQMLILEKRLAEKDELLTKELEKQKQDFVKKLEKNQDLMKEDYQKKMIELEKNATLKRNELDRKQKEEMARMEEMLRRNMEEAKLKYEKEEKKRKEFLELERKKVDQERKKVEQERKKGEELAKQYRESTLEVERLRVRAEEEKKYQEKLQAERRRAEEKWEADRKEAADRYEAEKAERMREHEEKVKKEEEKRKKENETMMKILDSKLQAQREKYASEQAERERLKKESQGWIAWYMGW